MLARVSLAIVVSIVLVAQQTAGASPITYDFTGTFVPYANTNFNGATQISGSFTINADPTVGGGETGVTENGSDVSITVNAGGQVFNFVNTQQNPNIATFSANVVQPFNPSGPPLVEYSWYAAMPSINPQIGFGMAFYSPGGAELLSNLRNFNYNLATSSFNFWGTVLGSMQGGSGAITSIEQVSTPEPSTLAVFVALGIAAMVHGRQKRRFVQ